MKIIAYIQADLRYNEYLLKKINGKSIIEHTINSIYELENISEIVLGLFNCEENKKINYLEKNYDKLKIVYSDEKNLTQRMYDICRKSDAEIIIRLTGEKLFLDKKILKDQLKELIDNQYEYIIPLKDNGLVADIFNINIFEKYKEDIMRYDRYYKFFTENTNNEFKGKIYHSYKYVTPSFYSYSVKNELDYDIARRIIEEKFDVEEENRILLSKIVNEDSLIHTTGWLKSFLNRDKFELGQECLPWMPYSIINFLADRINKEMNIFEYGSGNSTLWWSDKVASVCSVEHDSAWYNKLVNIVPNNVNLNYVKLDSNGDYCRKIIEFNTKFDIIIIDGRDRVNCAKNCINNLKEDGVIIWDDFGRDQYREGIKFLESNGFKYIDFQGMSPVYFTGGMTAIFYKSINCLKI